MLPLLLIDGSRPVLTGQVTLPGSDKQTVTRNPEARLNDGKQAGITENLAFKHLHQDAEHLYNTTMSLRAVVTQLTDRSVRLPRKVCLSCPDDQS